MVMENIDCNEWLVRNIHRFVLLKGNNSSVDNLPFHGTNSAIIFSPSYSSSICILFLWFLMNSGYVMSPSLFSS